MHSALRNYLRCIRSATNFLIYMCRAQSLAAFKPKHEAHNSQFTRFTHGWCKKVLFNPRALAAFKPKDEAHNSPDSRMTDVKRFYWPFYVKVHSNLNICGRRYRPCGRVLLSLVGISDSPLQRSVIPPLEISDPLLSQWSPLCFPCYLGSVILLPVIPPLAVIPPMLPMLIGISDPVL